MIRTAHLRGWTAPIDNDSGLTFMEVDSILKRLRPDLRYAEFLKRLRLPT